MSDWKLTREPMERFIDSIEVLSNGCWQWTRSLGVYGYGIFGIRQTVFPAHRFSYLVYKGEIPDKLVLDHLCRNKGCVNPDHLEAVTDRVNVVERGFGPTAINAKKTHCIRGHLFTGHDNRGRRICAKCMRIADLKYLNKRKVKELA